LRKFLQKRLITKKNTNCNETEEEIITVKEVNVVKMVLNDVS